MEGLEAELERLRQDMSQLQRTCVAGGGGVAHWVVGMLATCWGQLRTACQF